MLDTAELTPTARASLADGEVRYTNGLFTKEVVGGYTVIQVRDKAEAMEWR
ncbi:hypothetical protein ABIA39_008899 [Nocardia sp. GAS34]|uniref:hypothetical protein n=1 Tax=unclassified Nocardia TaxID=2637762 RepID=UPI003D26132E